MSRFQESIYIFKGQYILISIILGSTPYYSTLGARENILP